MAAPVLAASGSHAGNPTTAPTGTFGTTAAGDILIVLVTNGGSDSAPGSLTGTTVSTGGLTWTKKTDLGGGALTDLNGSLWWVRATGNHTGQTVAAATTNSGCLAWGRITGGVASGDPFDNVATVLNASGVNAITGFTPGVDETLVLLGLFTDDNIVSSTYAATGSPSSLTEAVDAGSTGGVDTQVVLASGQQSTAADIGVVSWANARGAGLYQVAVLATVKPVAVVTVDATLAGPLGGLTGTVAATPEHPASLDAPLGGLAAAMSAMVEAPPVDAVLDAPLGGVTGAVAAVVGHETVLAGPLGGLTAAATVVVQHEATLAAPLGALAAGTSATVEHPVSLTGPLGDLAAAAAVADLEHPATLAAPLGDLTATAAGSVQHDPVLAAQFGALTAGIAAGIEHGAALAAAFDQLDATIAADTTRDATLTADLGGLTAAFTATVDGPGGPVEAIFTAPLGDLLASVVATILTVTPDPHPHRIAHREITAVTVRSGGYTVASAGRFSVVYREPA